MNYKEKYQQWITDDFFNISTRNELLSITDDIEIKSRFCKEIEISGECGIQGKMGAGTNRINKYTVGRATKGFFNYLIDVYGIEECSRRGVVVGYDTKYGSEYYAKTVADVLSNMGIKVYIHAHARPTPQLSFSVKFWGAVAGIMITTSYASKEYNGMFYFDEYGYRLIGGKCKKINEYMQLINDYHEICFDGNMDLISMADLTDNYISSVLKQRCYVGDKKDVRIVYTPLHGTGNVLIQRCLRMDGFVNVDSVTEQVASDGDFSTIKSLNIEDGSVLKMAIAQAERSDGDIVFATDLGCSRIAIAVKTLVGYKLLTNDQIGALLIDYIASNVEFRRKCKPVIVKTISLSELSMKIAMKYGIQVFDTMNEFDNIEDKIIQLMQAENAFADEKYVYAQDGMGGYCVGMHASNYDAVVMGLLICELVAYYKNMGKSLWKRINELYVEFGYSIDF